MSESCVFSGTAVALEDMIPGNTDHAEQDDEDYDGEGDDDVDRGRDDDVCHNTHPNDDGNPDHDIAHNSKNGQDGYSDHQSDENDGDDDLNSFVWSETDV